MRLLSIIVLVLFSLNSSTAQMQNNNWCFGNNAGVSFNGGTLAPFVSNIRTNEGVAAVSHRTTGALLFYTSTAVAYNRNFTAMPNGNGIGTDNAGTCAQGVHIAPYVNDTNKFFVFTMSAYGTNGRLSYSVIDMTLDGGLGDVIAGQKYIPIDSGFSEGMVITEGCKTYWLVAFKRSTADFYAYQITSTGINTTPVISNTAYAYRTAGLATMKVSPDRTTLGIVSYHGTPGTYVGIHDFNPVTGTVTNGRVIDSGNPAGFYSCEFSPNSKLLYVAAFGDRNIYQYDLSQATTAAIAASKQTVNSGGNVNVGTLQIGPDSNIYAATRTSSLARISNPNGVVPNCVYTANVVTAITGTAVTLGLPQAVVHPIGSGGVGNFITSRDTLVCLKQPIVLYGRSGQTSYEWQDGSTGNTLSVSAEGTYWVRSPDTCGFFTDTVIVKNKRDTVSTTIDTMMCNRSSIEIRPSKNVANATYLWNTGSTDNKLTITQTGNYFVTTTEICDVTIDSFNVEALAVQVNVLQADTTICYGDTLLLSATVNPSVAKLKWNTEDTTLTTKASAAGRYRLEANFDGCIGYGDVYVENFPRISIELGPNREICADEPILLPEIATSEQTDVYLWQDGSTDRKFRVKEAGVYYVTVSNHCQTIRDTVTVTVRNCRLFFPDAFTPNGDGKNDIARFLGDLAYVTEYELHIFNRWGEEVFASNDIKAGWDGTHKGEPAVVDTYYYYIKYKYHGKDQIWKDNLILVR
ncbi:MAG: gliding motility-associated C-terminal domain-containing protein [Flavipsychrobacter sp.]